MNKQSHLWLWMQNKKVFATHEVMAWGVYNFYDRADRTKRDFLEKGAIKKLSEEEKSLRGYKCKDAVYQVV